MLDITTKIIAMEKGVTNKRNERGREVTKKRV
jgi:hypothetical protein